MADKVGFGVKEGYDDGVTLKEECAEGDTDADADADGVKEGFVDGLEEGDADADGLEEGDADADAVKEGADDAVEFGVPPVMIRGQQNWSVVE